MWFINLIRRRFSSRHFEKQFISWKKLLSNKSCEDQLFYSLLAKEIFGGVVFNIGKSE